MGIASLMNANSLGVDIFATVSDVPNAGPINVPPSTPCRFAP